MRNTKRTVNVLIFLLFIFLIGYFVGYAQNSKPTIPYSDLTPIEKCIQENREKFNLPSGYQKGVVYVVFKEESSIKEITNLFAKYNLTDYESSKNIYTIFVSENSEFQWVCILKDEPIVEFSKIYFRGGVL